MAKMRICAAAFLMLGVLCMVGCGENKDYRKVTGKVTMGGAPLEGADLMFYPQDSTGEGGGGKTLADGTYTITSSGATEGGVGLKPGQYKVTVTKFADNKDPDQEAFDKGEITYDELQQRVAAKGSYSKATTYELLTPAKYKLMNDTPLSVTVTNDPKANVFDFNLDE
ncbi:MAG: carboxypeptidase regulatory-like domain-containing protein [Thermoguttaceae bacterium]|nr:carboxypeptidase regulatory-like domain-containing protein [Thermoguttaceae bacterium]